MTHAIPAATLTIIVVTAVVSVLAFRDHQLKDKLIFCPEWILARKEYYRIVTSAFLHADWQHLTFNMITLYFFGENVELDFGVKALLAIYFSAIVGGGLLSIYLHRNHEYSSLGASGGVCGVLFATLFLIPGLRVASMFTGFAIPGWLFAILFMLSEFYGLRRQRDNIGHDAHLGGAIVGLLVATAMFPEIVPENPRLYPTVMVLSLLMFVYFWKNSLHLPWSSFFGRGSRQKTRVADATPSESEIDAILDKVSSRGIDSLTEKERRLLKRAAKK